MSDTRRQQQKNVTQKNSRKRLECDDGIPPRMQSSVVQHRGPISNAAFASVFKTERNNNLRAKCFELPRETKE